MVSTITTTRLSPVEDDRIADDSFLCAADCASVAAPDADRSFKLQFEIDSAEDLRGDDEVVATLARDCARRIGRLRDRLAHAPRLTAPTPRPPPRRQQ